MVVCGGIGTTSDVSSTEGGRLRAEERLLVVSHDEAQKVPDVVSHDGRR